MKRRYAAKELKTFIVNSLLSATNLEEHHTNKLNCSEE
jgi:hypothetical protein